MKGKFQKKAPIFWKKVFKRCECVDNQLDRWFCFSASVFLTDTAPFFGLDVGLLGAMSNLKAATIVSGNSIIAFFNVRFQN